MVNINLFGGQGIGKSTTAAGIFHELKINNFKVEYVQEFAKDLTYSKDITRLSDQLLILGEQHHRLYRLNQQVDYVVHDSPFVMGCTYLQDGIIPGKEFNALALSLFDNYRNINIFIERNNEDYNYQTYGRNGNLEDAIKKDKEILDFLNSNNIPYMKVKNSNKIVEDILEMIAIVVCPKP